MPNIVAISNKKGGVGKTTTSINLSAYVSEQHPTLLVDLDSQANATASLGIALGEQPSIHEVLIKGLSPQEAILSTRLPGLFLLPSSSSLVAGELELAPLMGREFKLRRAFQQIGDTYKYIFIDCPPAVGLLTLNAFSAAHKVVIPVQCEFLALDGLSELLTTVELVQLNLNPQLELAGLIMTMYDHRTSLSRQVVEEVRKHFPSTFQTVIPRNVRLAEAPSHGLSIMEYAPTSPAALAYKALSDELLAVLGD